MTYSNNSQLDKWELPIWRVLFNEMTNTYESVTRFDCKTMRQVCNDHVALIDKIRLEFQDNIEQFLVAFPYPISNRKFNKQSSDNLFELPLETLTHLPLSSNEFFTIYDLSLKEHIVVDGRIRNILGIEPTDFSFKALFGFDPENPLYHPYDYYHSLRFELIANFVAAIPNFEFKPLLDFYSLRFRVATIKSSIEVLRDLHFVTLEKRVSRIDEFDQHSPLGNRVLCKWSLYLENEIESSPPYFAVDSDRTRFMYEFWYLLNAHLLGLSPKLILMLDALNLNERNNAVEIERNTNINEFRGFEEKLDSNLVSGFFVKKLRTKIAELINVWEGRVKHLVIQSDLEVVQCAKRLGLLPVPRRIKEIIHQNVTEF